METWGISHLDGSFKLEQDRLGDENLAGLGAEKADLGLEELDLLARAAAPHLQEAVDYGVEINFVLVRHCERTLGPPSLEDGARTGDDGGCGSDGRIPSSRPGWKMEGKERANAKNNRGTTHFGH